jgi:hypothetical protein
MFVKRQTRERAVRDFIHPNVRATAAGRNRDRDALSIRGDVRRAIVTCRCREFFDLFLTVYPHDQSIMSIGIFRQINDGGLNFNGTIPITGATGTYNVPVFSYYHEQSRRSSQLLGLLTTWRLPVRDLARRGRSYHISCQHIVY